MKNAGIPLSEFERPCCGRIVRVAVNVSLYAAVVCLSCGTLRLSQDTLKWMAVNAAVNEQVINGDGQ